MELDEIDDADMTFEERAEKELAAVAATAAKKNASETYQKVWSCLSSSSENVG